MSRELDLEILRIRLDEGYKAYQDKMLSSEPHIIYESALEICCNQQVYDELYDGGMLDDDLLEQLLQYGDPLRMGREQWASWYEMVVHDEADIRGEIIKALNAQFEDEESLARYEKIAPPCADGPQMGM